MDLKAVLTKADIYTPDYENTPYPLMRMQISQEHIDAECERITKVLEEIAASPMIGGAMYAYHRQREAYQTLGAYLHGTEETRQSMSILEIVQNPETGVYSFIAGGESVSSDFAETSIGILETTIERYESALDEETVNGWKQNLEAWKTMRKVLPPYSGGL